MAQHLDYDPADEDLTVELQYDNGRCHSQLRLNELLLKMFSPWWKARLSASSFQDCGVGGARVMPVRLSDPAVGALALQAARLSLSLEDVQALGDVRTTFHLWQLADMWQFGYLVDLCHQTIKLQLRGLQVSELQQLLQPALNHSDSFLEEVLKPFFIEFDKERSRELYLCLGGAATLQLAEAAPIALFQMSSDFQEQLRQVCQQWSMQQVCEYMERNIEARSKSFYATMSPDTCARLFASAPLPRVTDMLQIVQDSSWSRKQRTRACRAIDLGRLLHIDLQHVKLHHRQLPQDASTYHALWQASIRFAEHSHVSFSLAPPWTFHFHSHKCGDVPSVQSGPVKLTFQTESAWHLKATFVTPGKSHGILLKTPGDWPAAPSLCQRGLPFHFTTGQVLLVIVQDAF
ncbi:hypothetical protein WJX74_007892 [Apatococcus lobatus]|uniref:BTB domain-containing protein n=1 Tax=Apatococcus lobatus TaxID=904363 RepID=A0AAW1RH25_9CHLO